MRAAVVDAGAGGASRSSGRSRSLLPHAPDPAARWPVTGLDRVGMLLLAAAAFALRLTVVLHGAGGLRGNFGDDGAAYYAGADAIVHGRMPYRDFVLLHPPLLDVALTPFALLGALTSDHLGYVAASLGFELLGAVDAVLIVLVSRRLGMARFPAVLAGAFYAVWIGSVGPGGSIALESLATLASLLGLLALTGVDRRRNLMLAGAAFGAAASVKIWGVAPALVLLVWWLLDRRTRRSARWLAGGMAAAVAVICGPFFLMAPRAMVRMVVFDQLHRGAMPRTGRLALLTEIRVLLPAVSGHERTLLEGVVCVCALVLAVCAARVPAARLVVALAACQFLVLWYSPSYFTHYAEFGSAMLALTVGAAAQQVSGGVPGDRARAWTGRSVASFAVLASAALTVHTIVLTPTAGSVPFPAARLKAVLAGAHCPTPDGPMALIQTNTLSSTLADGCPNWIDVTGRVYDVDRAPQGSGYPRTRNVRWQRALSHYLLSGDVVVLFRPGLGIGPALRRRIGRLPLLMDSDGVVAYRVRPDR